MVKHLKHLRPLKLGIFNGISGQKWGAGLHFLLMTPVATPLALSTRKLNRLTVTEKTIFDKTDKGLPHIQFVKWRNATL